MSSSEDLRAAQRAIVTALAQHQAYNYRASTAVVNRLNAEIDRLARRLALDLSDMLDSLTQPELQAFLAGRYTTGRLKALKAEIDGWGKALDEAIKAEWTTSAMALAGYEAAYVTELMGNVLEDLPKRKVLPEKAFKKAMQTPVVGRLVGDMLSDAAPAQVERVYATLRNGIASGQTNTEVIRALRGTQPLGFRDGIMQAAKNDVERLVRTARNHVANVVGEEVYVDLGVEYVRRSATLEGRTCKSCAALDGKLYKLGEPKPPATLHPNCRCRYVPAIDDEVMGSRPYVRALKVKGRDGKSKYRPIGKMTKKQREDAGLKVGQVKANTTFSSWFSNQDAAFQREWLGSSRYKLYKEGGLSLERFIDPQTGKQYSLRELRRRDAETFRQVFGT